MAGVSEAKLRQMLGESNALVRLGMHAAALECAASQLRMLQTCNAQHVGKHMGHTPCNVRRTGCGVHRIDRSAGNVCAHAACTAHHVFEA